MKNVLWIAALTFVMLFCVFTISNVRFRHTIQKHGQQLKWVAGKQDSVLITEADLDTLPEIVARYMRYSGVVGMKRISYLHLKHEGKFKMGPNSFFFPISGEYFLTTHVPAFIWYGKISLIPGITIAAVDRYYKSEGHMLIKLMSTITLSNYTTLYSAQSSFGRCVVEMSMVPTFFLDNKRIKWVSADSLSAKCVVSDSLLKAEAQLFFNPDSSLNKIVVNRYYDRGKSASTLEQFTGKVSGSKNHYGLVLPEVLDGYWNLKEGDLHYVHFTVDQVDFE
jgi:hypothetical protein